MRTSVVEMLFKFSSVLCSSKYHDRKQRKEVLVLFFVFSEDMSSLKIFISSSVYATIDPGTSSVVASPSCLVELFACYFLRRVDRFYFWLSRCRERKRFLMPLQGLVVQLKQGRTSSSLWKKESARSLVHALIMGGIDYYNSLLFGLPSVHLFKLQRLQSAAARLLSNVPRYSHITTALFSLHCLPVIFRIEIKILLTNFKGIHGHASGYLTDLIAVKEQSRYHLIS